MPATASLLGATDLAVLRAAADWREQGRRVAVATVVRTWGSAPRGTGSHLAIREDLHFAGSVSGGCVEGAVLKAAQKLAPGQGTLLTFGVSNEDAWEQGLACGGEIHVWLQDLQDPAPVAEAVRAVEHRTPVVVAWDLGGAPPRRTDASDPILGEAASEALRTDRAQTVDTPSGTVFVRPLAPNRRLFIIGAVHIAAALIPMARVAGWEVVLVDPRRGFASDERWPGVSRVVDYPDEAFEALGLDRHTAVVALTHDPKIDDPGLEAALASDVLYVGALGSRRTHARRLVRLEAAGVSPAQLDRIRGPIGLDIGAETPAEIAVSILAELTQALRRPA